jgi:Leucine rich repeat
VLSTLWFIPTRLAGTDDDNPAGVYITELDECTWQDVKCDDDGRVTALFLFKKNVQGRIPDDLGLLTAMTSLDLSNNTLSGTIPSSFGRLTAMTSLELRFNQMTGTIPSTFAAMTSLVNGNLDGDDQFRIFGQSDDGYHPVVIGGPDRPGRVTIEQQSLDREYSLIIRCFVDHF